MLEKVFFPRGKRTQRMLFIDMRTEEVGSIPFFFFVELFRWQSGTVQVWIVASSFVVRPVKGSIVPAVWARHMGPIRVAGSSVHRISVLVTSLGFRSASLPIVVMPVLVRSRGCGGGGCPRCGVVASRPLVTWTSI